MSDKLKNFLVNGFQNSDGRGQGTLDRTTDDEGGARPETDVELNAIPCIYDETEDDWDPVAEILESLADLKESVDSLKTSIPDISSYVTTREQLRSMSEALVKKDADASNKKLVMALGQLSVMREDFFKLCKGMREKIDKMDASDVLSSFEAYSVDIENILSDSGVYIGPFRFEGNRLNTLHHRIVDVVPTDDQEKSGTIAERLSDGYKIGDKILLKEKVKIYKFTGAAEAEETCSETICETTSSASGRAAGSTNEEVKE